MEDENNAKRQPCFMRKDIYDEIRKLTELNGSSIYNFTNDLLSASLQMIKSGVDIRNEISKFILLSKLINNYKGFMILVPFDLLKSSQVDPEKWKELGKSLMSYVSQIVNNVSLAFLSILHLYLSFIGDVNVDYENRYIEGFSPYFQGVVVDYLKGLIDGMLEAGNLRANVYTNPGMIRVKLINTKA